LGIKHSAIGDKEVIESREYPFLPVTFEIRHIREAVLAFVDTGFDGFFVLPDTYLLHLGIPDFVGRWTLADGSTVEAAEFEGWSRSQDFARLSKHESPAWVQRSFSVAPWWIVFRSRLITATVSSRPSNQAFSPAFQMTAVPASSRSTLAHLP
jgi:hypothetical protein